MDEDIGLEGAGMEGVVIDKADSYERSLTCLEPVGVVLEVALAVAAVTAAPAVGAAAAAAVAPGTPTPVAAGLTPAAAYP